MTDRVLPHDLDAEGAVLSAVLTGGLDQVRDQLDASDFYADANRRIYEAACQVDDAGDPVDLIAVAGRLNDANRLAQVGGSPYLVQLLEGQPAVGEVAQHCRRVADKARTRRIILAAQTIAAEGYGEAGADPAFGARAEQLMFDAAESGAQLWPTEQVAPIVQRIFARAGERAAGTAVHPDGLRLPWYSMRNVFPGGLELGQVHVVAARPGMGKSVFCQELCRGCASPESGALFVSLEMPRESLVYRMLAAESRVPGQTIRYGEPTRDQWSLLTDAATRLVQLPIAIWYRPGATIPMIRATVRREAARLMKDTDAKLRLMVVDYLQLVRGPARQSREVDVAEIMRELTYMAGEFGVTLVAASQLNRDCEKRTDKRPQLSDLRESGAIEQDAYSVSFLYRDDYYNRESVDAGTCEVEVAKHRDGPTGVVKMRFHGELSRFDAISDLDDPEDDEPRRTSRRDPDDESDGWHP